MVTIINGNPTISSMTEYIYKKIWELSQRVDQPAEYLELTRLTQELIRLYQTQGRLSCDPFSATRERVITTPDAKIRALLKDSTCIVTGGMGCVGSLLVKELLKYEVNEVIILDNSKAGYANSERVTRYNCDIRNLGQVNEIFSLYLPDFVFHAAAQRDPGIAEREKGQTVSTNVIGTLNVVKACEATSSVKQMVSSSTGKASRYFTEEIYAASKKVGEFMVDAYAQSSHVKYTMIRCTHILDNSLMNTELKEASERDQFVAIHSPGKYVTAQSASEAVGLMLNALIYSRERQCRFLLVRHLAWPVESLEMALYYISQSGRNIPVIFVGNPAGYSEKFFRGQLDWSKPDELNLLINVYERRYRRCNKRGDIIISRPCSVTRDTLEKVLDRIAAINSEQEVKTVLLNGLRDLVRESLKTVDRQETEDILRWGLDPKFLEKQNATPSDFSCIIPLLQESLNGGGASTDKVRELIYQTT
jgi:dTDP-4-dehydrorhamnose reductase